MVSRLYRKGKILGALRQTTNMSKITLSFNLCFIVKAEKAMLLKQIWIHILALLSYLPSFVNSKMELLTILTYKVQKCLNLVNTMLDPPSSNMLSSNISSSCFMEIFLKTHNLYL